MTSTLPPSRARRIPAAIARRIREHAQLGPFFGSEHEPGSRVLFVKSAVLLRAPGTSLSADRLYLCGESLVEEGTGTGRHGGQSVATSLIYTLTASQTTDTTGDVLAWLDVVDAIFATLQQDGGALSDPLGRLTDGVLRLDRAPKPVVLRDQSILAVELIATHRTCDFDLETRHDLSAVGRDGLPNV